jgi:hypothetical protein
VETIRFYGVVTAGVERSEANRLIGDSALIIENEMFGAVAR